MGFDGVISGCPLAWAMRPAPSLGRHSIVAAAMIVSRAVTDNLTKASWIRRMFEEGARLKAERGADKVFDFTLGNPEIEPPAAVLAAARRVLESTAPHLHAYMPNAGHVKVREAVAGRLRASTGLPYTAGHVLMTVGAGAALNTVLKALLDPGDEVLTVAPFFAEYTFYAENHGGRLVVVPPRADLTPDIARLEAAITPKTRVILVNSPNNPSGVIYPAAAFVEIEALLSRAARPIVLVSDEPYRSLVFDDVVVPEVPPLVTRSIVATSWSKSLAIPGERIGYLAFSPRMPEAAQLFEACTFTSRVLGFVNAPALWQWVVAEVGDQVIDVAPYREKRDLMYEGLTRIGYRCVKPEGAFLFSWPSIIAVIVNYAKRSEVRGTWLESHFRWQIRTFWFGALWVGLSVLFVIATLGIGIFIAWITLGAVGLWFIYRIARGWLRLMEHQAMYV